MESTESTHACRSGGLVASSILISTCLKVLRAHLFLFMIIERGSFKCPFTKSISLPQFSCLREYLISRAPTSVLSYARHLSRTKATAANALWNMGHRATSGGKGNRSWTETGKVVLVDKPMKILIREKISTGLHSSVLSAYSNSQHWIHLSLELYKCTNCAGWRLDY